MDPAVDVISEFFASPKVMKMFSYIYLEVHDPFQVNSMDGVRVRV